MQPLAASKHTLELTGPAPNSIKWLMIQNGDLKGVFMHNRSFIQLLNLHFCDKKKHNH